MAEPGAAPRRASARGRFGRNFAYMLAGNTSYALLLWATLAVLAKLGSPEAVGQFNLGFAIAGPVMLLLNLNLRALKATDARDEFPFSTYLSLRVLCAVAAVGVVAIIVAVSDYAPSTRQVILAVALAKALEAVSDIVYGLLQKREEMGWIAGSRVLRGVLTLAAVWGVFVATGEVTASTWALAGAWLVILLALDLPVAARRGGLALGRDAESLRLLLRTSLPLGVVMMLVNLNSNLPIYFLSWSHGEATVGYYSAINYIGVAATTIATAISQAVAPRLGRLHASGQVAESQRLLRQLVLLGLCMGLGGSLWSYFLGAPTLTLLYTREYAVFTEVLLLLMLGYGFGFAAAFVGVGLTANRSLRIMLPINLLTLGLNAGLCAALIPRFGMLGAAWSVGISLAFKLCANYWAVTRKTLRDG